MLHRRINITLPADVHELASDVSRIQATPLSRTIAGLLVTWLAAGAPRCFEVTPHGGSAHGDTGSQLDAPDTSGTGDSAA